MPRTGLAGLLGLALSAFGCENRGLESHRLLAERAALMEGAFPPADFSAVPPVTVVGAMEEPVAEVFGLLGGGVRFPSGWAVLMDERLQRLVLLDVEGEVRHIAGRPGQGPGEFRYLVSIRAVTDSSVAVYDRGNSRLSIYALRGDSLALAEAVLIPGLMRDACILGEEVFVLAVRDDRLVEAWTRGGEVVRAFGTIPLHPTEGLSTSLREGAVQTLEGGLVVCLSEPRLIVVAAKSRPEVRAFTPEGELVWESTLADYRPLRIQVGGIGYALAPPDGTGEHHRTLVLHPMGDALLVQLAVLDWLRREPGAREIDSRLLELASGREVGRTKRLPIVGEAIGEHGLLIVSTPFPQAALVQQSAVEEVLSAQRN